MQFHSPVFVLSVFRLKMCLVLAENGSNLFLQGKAIRHSHIIQYSEDKPLLSI